MYLFKGYIGLGGKNGKTPIEEYKNRNEFYELEDVEALKGYGGVLKDEIIQIDIDDSEQAEILFNIVEKMNLGCDVLKTTRGMHFYFENTGICKRSQGRFNAIGLKQDIGLGIQNAVIPLKVDGVCREFIRIVDELEPLPVWLRPISRTPIDFTKMGEGDGRNASLFGYILTLQSDGIGVEDIKDTIRVINEFVLSKPLDADEIDVILRDESFLMETFYVKNKLQYEKLATYMRDNDKIIKINDKLHIYVNGVYSDDVKEIERCMIKYIKNSRNAERMEIIRYLELLCDEREMSSPRYVLLENGIFDLSSKELLEHNPKYIIKNKISIRYNSSAYSKVMDNTLNKICCKDEELRCLLEEMIGYCLLRRNELGKSFILTGGGSNGKSTFLKVLKVLIGKDNISSVALDELNHRFKTYQLEGKLANIGDDISNKYIEDNSTFKNLTTGETVNVERKGRDAFDFNNYSKLIFSANELPRINDLTDGLKRRLLFVPFNARFSRNDDDFDPFIYDKLLERESMEYLLRIGLEGLERILMNNSFSPCAACEIAWEEYESMNNPIVSFVEEFNISGNTVRETYLKYSTWCVENGLRAVSKPIFGREVKKLGYHSDKTRKINGKVYRIYLKDGEE